MSQSISAKSGSSHASRMTGTGPAGESSTIGESSGAESLDGTRGFVSASRHTSSVTLEPPRRSSVAPGVSLAGAIDSGDSPSSDASALSIGEIERAESEDYMPSYKKNYELCSNCTSFGAYDFQSVMHYPTTVGFQGRTAIKAKPGLCENEKCVMGQREGLSPLDVEDVQLLYNCGNRIYKKT